MVGTSAMFESIFYNADQHKLGYNTWHRWNIEILTLDHESTWKTGSGGVSYVMSWWGSTHSNFGNSH